MTVTKLPVFKEPRPIWIAEHEKCDENFVPFDVFYMSTPQGDKVRVSLCPTCGYIDMECLHVRNNPSLKTLRLNCLLCGA